MSTAAAPSRSASESDSASSTSSPRKANRKVAFGPEVTPEAIAQEKEFVSVPRSQIVLKTKCT